MTLSMTVILYGNADSKENARAIFENLPQVKRMDYIQEMSQCRLVLCEPLHETSLIPQLASSGICGFRLVND